MCTRVATSIVEILSIAQPLVSIVAPHQAISAEDYWRAASGVRKVSTYLCNCPKGISGLAGFRAHLRTPIDIMLSLCLPIPCAQASFVTEGYLDLKGIASAYLAFFPPQRRRTYGHCATSKCTIPLIEAQASKQRVLCGALFGLRVCGQTKAPDNRPLSKRRS